MLPSLIAFLAAAGLLTLTPGMDTALVLRTAAAEGRSSAMRAAVGIGVGCLIWGAAVAVGIGAMLTTSPLAFAVLKWAGAGYLVFLGVQLILKPRRRVADPAADGAGRRARSGPLLRGLTTNLLNPKIGVFYVSFLPQFVPVGAPAAPWIFLLACLHVALGLMWFSILVAATAPIGRILARPGVLAWLDRLTGCVFIAFGARLALARRG